MLARLGVWEIMAIIAIVTLIFGSKKLPDIGKSIGESIQGFKKGVKGDD